MLATVTCSWVNGWIFTFRNDIQWSRWISTPPSSSSVIELHQYNISIHEIRIHLGHARAYLLIWEVCTLNASCIYTHFNENTVFQYIDKIGQSSSSQLPAIAHLQCPESARPTPGCECSSTTHWGWRSLYVMLALEWKLCACHRRCKHSTSYFERFLLATYCITPAQAKFQSYFNGEKDKKGTWVICLKLQRESTGGKERGTRSLSSFLCSGHLLTVTRQRLNEITRNTPANTTHGNLVSHSPLPQEVGCRFQNDKTQTNLRMKTSKKMKRNLTRLPMQVNSTRVPARCPIHAAFHWKLQI